MQPEFFAAVVAVLSVSMAINGFFLKAAFVELRELRAADRKREVDMNMLAVHVGAIEHEVGLELPLIRGLS